jgi:hypothetical protein
MLEVAIEIIDDAGGVPDPCPPDRPPEPLANALPEKARQHARATAVPIATGFRALSTLYSISSTGERDALSPTDLAEQRPTGCGIFTRLS